VENAIALRAPTRTELERLRSMIAELEANQPQSEAITAEPRAEQRQ